MRRSERQGDPWSGHWSFPGGRFEPQDRDLLDTALRELNEECGVALNRAGVEQALPCACARRRTGPRVLVAPFVFGLPAPIETTPDFDEAVETRWLPLAEVRDPANHTLTAVPGLPFEMLFPAVPLPGMPLWGFTYRLITDWLGLAGSGSGPDYVREQLRELGATRAPYPVEAVVERLSRPWPQVPAVNAIEVRRDLIRVTDLDFDVLELG